MVVIDDYDDDIGCDFLTGACDSFLDLWEGVLCMQWEGGAGAWVTGSTTLAGRIKRVIRSREW